MVKTIVLCIDRDNDIGDKTGRKGPIIGAKENLRAARELALKDPEDTDVNAIFGAVKIAQESNTEVITLTGDRNVGVISDTKIAEQLDQIIQKFSPESVILVTDGQQDEEILPIIESRVKISALRTIIMRQSKELEKAYFRVTHFLQEVSKDPTLARLVFGIPGLTLLLLAIGGMFNIISIMLNLVLAIVGIYLIIKGLGYEEELFSRTSEFINSMSIERISTIAYVLALITFIIGIGYAIDEYTQESPQDFMGIIAVILTLKSGNLILLAIIIAIIGKIIDEYATNRYLKIRKDIIFLSLLLLVKIIAESGIGYYQGGSVGDFIMTVLLSVILFALIIKVTEQIFMSDIRIKNSVIKEFAGKNVYTPDGQLVGVVSGVLLDGSRLKGLRVGKRVISPDEIISNKGAVMVHL